MINRAMLADDRTGLAEADASRKRRRPAFSCLQCRQRKVKCDRSVPCTQCLRARASIRCSLETDSASSSAHQQILNPYQRPMVTHISQSDEVYSHARERSSRVGLTTHASISSQQSRSDTTASPSWSTPLPSNLSTLREHTRGLDELISKGPNENIFPARFEALERAVENLQNHLQELKRPQPEAPSVQGDLNKEAGLRVPLGASRVLVTADKTKFYGPTHWLYILEQFRLLLCMNPKRQSGPIDSAHREIYTLAEKCQALRRSIQDQCSITSINIVSDIRDTIPPRRICDQLVHKYLGTLELVYRVLHIPSFWKAYDRYWEQPQTISTRFLVTLGLVLAIGSTFYEDQDTFDSIRSLAPRWIYAAEWWLNGPTQRKTHNLEGLQIYCLLFLSRQTNSLGRSKHWVSSQSLLAFVFHLGFHRDPKHFPDLSPFQSEMRRRLWASVLEIVVQSSLNSSLPPLISWFDFDCEAPSNIADREFDEATREPPPSKPSSALTETSLQILLLKSLKTRYDTVALINDFTTRQPYSEVLKLGSDIKDLYHDLHSFFQKFIDTPLNPNYKLTSFHRKLIEMIFQRFILSLHQPFMILARRDPTFYFSRKLVSKASMVLLSSINNLDISTGLPDDFSRLTALGSGTFNGAISRQPIMALCLEVVTQMEEEDHPERRNNASSPDLDFLDEVNRAARQPLVRILERTFEQLLHLVDKDRASLKAYCFLAAVLSQIKCIEAGEAPEARMREAIKSSLERCHELLLCHASTVIEAQPGDLDTDYEGGDTPATPWSFDLDFLGLAPPLDTPGTWS